jgi:glycine/D-amino acid oxidase-like deaminating enzyme
VVTRRKNLRGGRTVWQGRSAPTVPHSRLSRDLATDVLVIGAGITGAIIADALASEGLKVVVVDRRELASGATAANTALVLHEIDIPLIKLARKIGKEKAVRAWRRSRLAVDALAARLGEIGVRNVARRDTLYLAGNVLNKDGLRRERAARRASGLSSAFLDRAELQQQFGIARSAALMGYDNLVLDPRKTALALLKAAAGNGACVFTALQVADLKPTKRGVTAIASNGHKIRCRYVVFATGYEPPKGVPRRHYRINSTWAIATVRQARRRFWPGECCIWEASDPYLYIRTTPEGRVVCGGEDEPIADAKTRDALLRRKTVILRRKLHRLLPKLDATVEFAWTGAFGQSSTGLPIIDRMPGMPHCWIALGYGGNGITYAAIAADIISGAIGGRLDVDADLYRFSDHGKAAV